jgi:hypothetical protein
MGLEPKLQKKHTKKINKKGNKLKIWNETKEDQVSFLFKQQTEQENGRERKQERERERKRERERELTVEERRLCGGKIQR